MAVGSEFPGFTGFMRQVKRHVWITIGNEMYSLLRAGFALLLFGSLTGDDRSFPPVQKCLVSLAQLGLEIRSTMKRSSGQSSQQICLNG